VSLSDDDGNTFVNLDGSLAMAFSFEIWFCRPWFCPNLENTKEFYKGAHLI
jgi:hypothetical protein